MNGKRKRDCKKNIVSVLIDESLNRQIVENCHATGSSKSSFVRSAISLKNSIDANGPEISLLCGEMIELLKKYKDNIPDYERIVKFPVSVMNMMLKGDD